MKIRLRRSEAFSLILELHRNPLLLKRCEFKQRVEAILMAFPAMPWGPYADESWMPAAKQPE